MRISHVVVFFAAAGLCAYAQEAATADGAPAKMDKRVFGVLPNYRTADGSLPFEPIGPGMKMTIAAKDTFDWPLGLLGAAYAGLGQLSNQYPSLGQGTKGYANRFVRSYADQAMGNFLSEGVMPVLLREDPRYFRRGEGDFWGRLGYAATRIFVTRTDSGGNRLNCSELLGNSIAVGASNAYYSDTRTAAENIQKLGVQLATDSLSNVLKEFWPDVKRKLFTRH